MWGLDSQAGCPALRSVSILYCLCFSLAGTRIPSATHWWWPEPLALRARVKSPSIQGPWCWGPQLKPPSWEGSLPGPSAGSSEMSLEGRDGVLGEEIVRLKSLGVCSGTVHSNSPKRKATFLKALVAWNHSWAWRSAAPLWTIPVTICCPCLLPESESHSVQSDSLGLLRL